MAALHDVAQTRALLPSRHQQRGLNRFENEGRFTPVVRAELVGLFVAVQRLHHDAVFGLALPPPSHPGHPHTRSLRGLHHIPRIGLGIVWGDGHV